MATKSFPTTDSSVGIFFVTTTTVSHDGILGNSSGQIISARSRRTLFRSTALGANLAATIKPKRGYPREDGSDFMNKKEPFKDFPFLKTASKSFLFLRRFLVGRATIKRLDRQFFAAFASTTRENGPAVFGVHAR